MTPADLAHLHGRCFTMPPPFAAAEFEALLAGPGCFLIHETGGFAMGRAVAGEAELLTLAVDPAARRKGLGRRLLRGFEEGAINCGAGAAFLEVADDNLPARALYRDAGYEAAGCRRGYYRAPDGARIDALILRKALVGG